MTAIIVILLVWLGIKGLATYVSFKQTLLIIYATVFVIGLINGGITYSLGGNAKNARQGMLMVWFVFGVLPTAAYCLYQFGIVPLWHALA